jgi:hypothetical protein
MLARDDTLWHAVCASREMSGTGEKPMLGLRNANAADQILKPGVATERIESGIHPDPRYSSRALEVGFLERSKGLFSLAHLGIDRSNDKAADVTLLGLLQGRIQQLPGPGNLADSRKC